jgi:hypothetical protein
VFAFGDAPYLGSMGAQSLAAPVIGIVATPSFVPRPYGFPDRPTEGYFLAGADGGIFAFGNAPFSGSSVGASTAPVIGVGAINTTGIYGDPPNWTPVVAARDGTQFAQGLGTTTC